MMGSFPAAALWKDGRDTIIDYVHIDCLRRGADCLLDLRVDQMLAKGR